MYIERARVQTQVFNLDDNEDLRRWEEILSDPAVRVLNKKFINHTESETSGRDRTETKEVHLYVEWEECSL